MKVLLGALACWSPSVGQPSCCECLMPYPYHESCGFPEVASAVLLQAVDMESVVVNAEYLSVGNHG